VIEIERFGYLNVARNFSDFSTCSLNLSVSTKVKTDKL